MVSIECREPDKQMVIKTLKSKPEVINFILSHFSEIFNSMSLIHYQDEVWKNLENDSLDNALPPCQMKIGMNPMQIGWIVHHNNG